MKDLYYGDICLRLYLVSFSPCMEDNNHATDTKDDTKSYDVHSRGTSVALWFSRFDI